MVREKIPQNPTTLGVFDKKPQKSMYFAPNQAVLGQNQGFWTKKPKISPTDSLRPERNGEFAVVVVYQGQQASEKEYREHNGRV